MAGPMKAGQLSNGRILWWTALAGVPMGIGALTGSLVVCIKYSIVFVSRFAAGAMLYVVLTNFYLKLTSYQKGIQQLGAIIGVILGIMVSLF